MARETWQRDRACAKRDFGLLALVHPGTTIRNPGARFRRSALVELGLATRATSSASSATNRPGLGFAARKSPSHAHRRHVRSGLYRDVLDEEAAYLLSLMAKHGSVFAEDEEQVDKIAETSADRVPSAQAHRLFQIRAAMRKYDDPAPDRRRQARRDGPRPPRRACATPALLRTNWSTATKGEDCANPLPPLRAPTRRHPETRDAPPPAACCGIAPPILAFDPKGPDDEYVSVLAHCPGSWSRSYRARQRPACAG